MAKEQLATVLNIAMLDQIGAGIDFGAAHACRTGQFRQVARDLPPILPAKSCTKTPDEIPLQRGTVARIGQDDIIDEVRVIIRDENSTTAYFTFSSQITPVPHQLRLYGPKNSLIVDDDHQILIKIGNTEYKSYLRYFVPPLQYAKQYVANFSRNVIKFIKKDFHMPNDAALKTLIESFYDSIAGNAPLPLSYREILLTSKIMDDIFAQIKDPCRTV